MIYYLVSAISYVTATETFDLGETAFDPSQIMFDKSVSPLQINLAAGYSDNYNALLESDIQASSIVAAVNGSIVSKQQNYWFEANYLAATNMFQLSDTEIPQDDQYNAFDLNVNNRFFLSSHWSIDLNARVKQADERIGTGISKFRANIAQKDSVNITQGAMKLTFGAEPRYRSIQLNLVKSKRNYDDVHSYSNLFDQNTDLASLYSNFTISDQTQLIGLLEYRKTDNPQLPSADSTNYRALAGAAWKFSGKTKVMALVGAYQRKGKSNADTSGLNWELKAEFYPRQDVLFNLSSQRNATVADNNEQSIDTLVSQHELELLYFYSEQWRFGAKSQLRTLDYEQETLSSGSDELNTQLLCQLILSEQNQIHFTIGFQSLEDQSRNVDYTQNTVKVAWQYEY
ncbi:hypothetical protein GLIP_3180 [Aliiglaciecola lipolytica E3]|uniref:Capsular polysaccharide synthesis enzyme CpsB n=2 Tax=Aliiglaciecola TaxID=1406885 RepID=K6YCA2_9ALTE|nr:hypothetical protein GLIP_3180 [Aliiglaciecola lipolytica E3]